MEKLNSDILQEIVSRLPKTNAAAGIKSVLQCRQVCQLWRSLLGKPKQGTLFVIRPICGGDIKFYYREESSKIVSHNLNKMVTEINSIKTDSWSFSFVGTCNGLVCFQLLNFIYIYNPITGESIRFPKTGSPDDLVGFGYCESAKTYKVVKIGRSASGKLSVQVYTLGDGSGWRNKPEITYWLSGSGILANGALHWLNQRSGCDIVAFDLTDETFRSIPPPPFNSDSYVRGVLGSCGGNLYLSASCRHAKEGGVLMDIWVLEEKNMNSLTWITVFSSEWSSLSASLVSRTESEILLWENGVLNGYNPITFKKIWDSGTLGTVYGANSHMPSLVSLKHLGEERVDCSVLTR